MEHRSGMRSCRSEGTLTAESVCDHLFGRYRVPTLRLPVTDVLRVFLSPSRQMSDMTSRYVTTTFHYIIFNSFFIHNFIIQRWANENVVRWTWLRKHRRYINKQFDLKQIRLVRWWRRCYRYFRGLRKHHVIKTRKLSHIIVNLAVRGKITFLCTPRRHSKSKHVGLWNALQKSRVYLTCFLPLSMCLAKKHFNTVST